MTAGIRQCLCSLWSEGDVCLSTFPGLDNAGALGRWKSFVGRCTQKCSVTSKDLQKGLVTCHCLLREVHPRVKGIICWGWICHSHTYQVPWKFSLQGPQGSNLQQHKVIVTNECWWRLERPHTSSKNRQCSVLSSKWCSEARESSHFLHIFFSS